jgi:hypothetical protein
MTTLKTTIAVAAVLSALSVTPVFAQAAIQEPGLFAFNYPNRDVLNGGVPTPAARLSRDPVAAANSHFTATPERSGRNWRLNH